ncbi:rod shape-determining protein RodA [bacterium]|nr:rod shape-determining protein RodA [bacterium]
MLIHLKKLDWILIFVALLLVGIGLLSIYSSSVGEGDFLNFKKQLIFLVVGIVLMFSLSFFDWRTFRENPYLILTLYFLCLISLAGLLLFGPKIRGVRSWYKIGPLSFEPVEFTKIVLIILLAKYFSMRHVELYRVRHILLSGLYILIPILLIFFQPDMGQILIISTLWIAILIVSGIKLRHFLILCFLFILVLILSWQFILLDYQKARILSFIMPQFEPLGTGWNQRQAKIAIGSGGIFGKGIGQGCQVQFGFLPEPQTDFIFAALAEETGLIGISIMFILFSILFWRIIKIGESGQNNFVRLFALGFGILLAIELLINISANLGLIPVIGISLPLVSYGGSNLISTFIGFGILQSVKTHIY